MELEKILKEACDNQQSRGSTYSDGEGYFKNESLYLLNNIGVFSPRYEVVESCTFLNAKACKCSG